MSERDRMYRSIAGLASAATTVIGLTWRLCLGRLLRWAF